MQNQLKHYKALLFDLNGTMIDDMPYHIKAWHRILVGLGANLTWEEMKQECYGKNEELLERIFPGHFSAAEKEKLCFEKEKQYQKEFEPELKLIEGLDDFLKESYDAGIKTAIGSAAVMDNVDFVLDGLNIRHYINAVVSADNVDESKPHPETFLKCADILAVSSKDCLVFEDAPKGAECALNAGMDCLVITTLHKPEEFSTYKNVIGFISNFDDPFLRKLIKWKQTA
jgi:beta-phosphoglucomutase